MQSDNAMHVSIADPNGNITPLFANPADGSDLGPAIPIPYDPDFLQLNTASYWTLGTWHTSLSDGGLAAVLGHVSFIAIDAAPQAGGGSAKQNSPKIPEIAHFVPVSAQTLGIDPQELLRQIKEDLPQPGKAIHYPFLGPDATVEKFTTTLAKPLSTVGFIGHSVDFSNAINNQIVVYSVGLLLADKRLVAPPSDDPQYPVPPYENAVVAERIKTQAKVVFIGSCFVAPTFQNLWNISNDSKNQALIVPMGQSEVILGHAAAAWAHLLHDLVALHMKVNAAVSETNAWLLTQHDVNGHPVTEQWQVIGDGNVKID